MSDDKPKPIDDLKEGLGLLFRAAKGAVEKLPTAKVEEVAVKMEDAAKDVAKEVGRAFEKLPTGKVEEVAKEAVKEMGRAFETLGDEIDRAFGSPKPQAPPPPPPEAKHYDDGYAPEPPKDEPPRGPRIG